MVYLPFFVLLAACGTWFYTCAAKANRGSGARWLSAVIGGGEFTLLLAVLRPMIEDTHFFRSALYDLGDFGAIMAYIVLPCLIAVFVSGLLLRRRLARPAAPLSEAPQ
jgi:hypothetical protein